LTNPKYTATAQMPTLAYRIEQTVVGQGKDRRARVQTVFVEWCEGETVNLTADQAVAATRERNSRTAHVDHFLRQFLAKGPRLVRDVELAGGKLGLTHAQLRQARQRLGVKSQKQGLDGNEWHLPSAG
jgi:hypothetical protein